MKRHAEILRPKFEAVVETLEEELGDLGICQFTRPKGGYFISFDLLVGSARHALNMTSDAGVSMTPAGSTFPYHSDPYDRNIRIAPTFPSVADLKTAATLFTVCVRLAAVERLLGLN